MIIHISNSGQTGNQLMSLSSAVALGLKYQDKVYCLACDPKLKENFQFNTQYITGAKLVFKYNRFLDYSNRCWLKIRNYIKENGVSTYHRDYPKWVPQIFNDWISYKENDSLIEYAEQIRTIFRIQSTIEEGVGRKMKELKKHHTLIAVHMRRGDYKEFRGGILLFGKGFYRMDV